MKKDEFLKRLEERIKTLPKKDRDRALGHYRTRIQTEMLLGKDEEDAVDFFASVDEIANNLLAAHQAKEEERARRREKLKGKLWLLILTFPFIAVFYTLVAIAVATCFIIGLLAVTVCSSVLVSGIAAILFSIYYLFISSSLIMFMLILGIGFTLAGVGMFLLGFMKPIIKYSFIAMNFIALKGFGIFGGINNYVK